MKLRNSRIFVFLSLAVVLLSSETFALDNMWNMRYTYGPDSRPVPKFAAGVGLRSDFSDNVLIPINLVGQIAKDWDLGAKVDIFSYNELDNTIASVDFGGRFRFSGSNYLELDGYFGLNRNNGSAVVVTYGREHYIAKSFSNSYEARAGFLEGVTDKDGFVKLGVGTTPTLHFGKSVLCMIEITSTGSIGHIQDDFMVDIIPKLEAVFGSTRIHVEFDVGVLQDDNNDQKSIALYVMNSF